MYSISFKIINHFPSILGNEIYPHINIEKAVKLGTGEYWYSMEGKKR